MAGDKAAPAKPAKPVEYETGEDGFLTDKGVADKAAAEAALEARNAGAIEPRKYTFRAPTGTDDTVTAENVRQLDFQQLAEAFGVVEASEAIGTDQFGPILEDKGKLVGVPLAIVHWEFYDGDFGQFVSAWILTQTNDRYIVNDGSSGIYQQLRQLTSEKGIDSMLVAKHGLRVSKYDKEVETDKGLITLKDCETFYVDTKL